VNVPEYPTSASISLCASTMILHVEDAGGVITQFKRPDVLVPIVENVAPPSRDTE
jgi:hypothetical protein